VGRLWELFTRRKPWDGKALPQLVYPVLSGKRPGPLPQVRPFYFSLLGTIALFFARMLTLVPSLSRNVPTRSRR
jgi:hypothetical protein